jgi:hypothetical protein
MVQHFLKYLVDIPRNETYIIKILELSAGSNKRVKNYNVRCSLNTINQGG